MMTAHELFGFMSPKLASEIIEWTFQEDKPTYKAALQGVATAKKVRPVFMQRQPRPQREAAMIAAFGRPVLEETAGAILRNWLTKAQKQMLMDFLDGIEVEHEEGVVEDLPESVADDKLNNAINTILEKYDREHVAVYLNAFNSMNETAWPNLDGLLRADDRLQLHG